MRSIKQWRAVFLVTSDFRSNCSICVYVRNRVQPTLTDSRKLACYIAILWTRFNNSGAQH
jgi:hypothetical protein